MENIFEINTEQQKQLNGDTKKFNKDTNYSENISWKINNFDSNAIINDPNILSYKYFENIDLSSYKTINLYFRSFIEPFNNGLRITAKF